jgi:hypothetical protein
MKRFYTLLTAFFAGTLLMAADNTNLVLHLPLNEGSGDVVKDIGPRKLTGKIIDAAKGAAWVEGREENKALHIAGNNGKAPFVLVEGFKADEFSNGMTVMCYVKPDKDKYIRSSIWHLIASNRTGKGFLLAIHYERLLIGGDGNKLTKYANSVNTKNPIRGGEWIHLAATQDGKGTFKVYIDGALAGTSSEKMSGPVTPGNGSIVIGSLYGYSPMQGTVADVKLYNKALSDAEIMDLASN